MRLFIALLLVVSVAACASETRQPATEAAPETVASDISVRFVRPLDGDSVTSPVGIVMEVQGVALLPAGEMVEGAGHLHVLVDTLFVNAGQVIPKNEHHLHFGDASTETEIALAPGEHVLRLQFGDGAHIAQEGDEYRDEIRIVVLPGND